MTNKEKFKEIFNIEYLEVEDNKFWWNDEYLDSKTDKRINEWIERLSIDDLKLLEAVTNKAFNAGVRLEKANSLPNLAVRRLEQDKINYKEAYEDYINKDKRSI